MLTVAIASGDKNTSSQLLASLEQTGLIGGSIKHWSMPMEKLPDVGKRFPTSSFWIFPAIPNRISLWRLICVACARARI